MRVLSERSDNEIARHAFSYIKQSLDLIHEKLGPVEKLLLPKDVLEELAEVFLHPRTILTQDEQIAAEVIQKENARNLSIEDAKNKVVRQQDFFKTIGQYFVTHQDEWTPIERRLVANEIIAAYYLFVGGGLIQAYAPSYPGSMEDPYKTSNKVDIRSPHNDVARLAIGAQALLTRNILRLINSEKHSPLLPLVTRGIEAENVKYVQYDYLRKLINDAMSPPHGQLKLPTMDDLSLYLSSLPSHPTDITQVLMISHTLDPRYQLMRLGLMDTSLHESESITQPSLSYQVLLSDVWHLLKGGLITPEFVIHQTFMGFEVNPFSNRTEIKDILLLYAAAGLVNYDLTEDVLDEYMEGTEVPEESFAKGSRASVLGIVDPIYMAFLTAQEARGSKILPYPFSELNSLLPPIEHRSMSPFKSFLEFARYIRSMQFITIAIAAHQHVEQFGLNEDSTSQPSQLEIKLAIALDKLLANFQQMYDETIGQYQNAQHYPLSTDTFVNIPPEKIVPYMQQIIGPDIKSASQWQKALAQIEAHFQRNPNDRESARALLNAFHTEVEGIIS